MITRLPALALGLFLAASGPPAAAAPRAQDPAVPEPAPAPTEAAAEAPGFLAVARGEGLLELLVPRHETLTYEARLGLGMIEAHVGTVTLSSRVEPYRASLLGGGGKASGETASIVARAFGGYTVYQLDSSLETRFQPSAWPAMIHRMTQSGTEKRRRETLVGTRAGEPHATYRSDTSAGAPPGTRIWGPAVELEPPPGVVDSLGGVFLVRTMLRDGLTELDVPVLDKHRVWNVNIQLGEASSVATRAGVFNARPVLLHTTRLDPEDGEEEQFSGPFGIRGDIRLWVEESTGVPVVISGTLPAGPLEIDLDIRLKAFEGCPEGFAKAAAAPVEAAAERPVEAPAEPRDVERPEPSGTSSAR